MTFVATSSARGSLRSTRRNAFSVSSYAVTSLALSSGVTLRFCNNRTTGISLSSVRRVNVRAADLLRMEPASAEWIATAVFGEPGEPKAKRGCADFANAFNGSATALKHDAVASASRVTSPACGGGRRAQRARRVGANIPTVPVVHAPTSTLPPQAGEGAHLRRSNINLISSCAGRRTANEADQ